MEEEQRKERENKKRRGEEATRSGGRRAGVEGEDTGLILDEWPPPSLLFSLIKRPLSTSLSNISLSGVFIYIFVCVVSGFFLLTSRMRFCESRRHLSTGGR